MGYIKTTWVDDETVVDATKMNNIEDGIENTNGKLVNISNEVDEDYRVNFLKSKNLFDGILEDGSISNTTGENTNIANRKRTANYIPVKPNTIYTLSYQISAKLIVLEYNANKGFIQAQPQTDWHTSPYTFTTSASTKYIRFIADTSNLTTAMLNEGSTALPYEPYITPSIYVDNEEIYNQNIMNYSTGEQVIGKWINGKPLYRKVVQITTPADANYYEMDLKISNIETIMLKDNSYIINSTYLIPFNASNSNAAYTTWASPLTTGKLAITNAGTAVRSKTAYVCVEYTKTTD